MIPHRPPLLAFLCWATALAVPHTLHAQQDPDPVVIASKPFAESYLLAETFAQLLEDRGFRVDRRMGLGATEIVLQALVRGDIDLYPEYTGTGLAVAGDQQLRGDAAEVFAHVSDVFRERWGARWLPPLGFANDYAIAMRRGHSDSLGVTTLTGLARAAPALTGGFSPDFMGRPDGLAGLAGAYDIRLRETRSLLQAVKYQALAEGAVDVIDAYSTDGAIARYDLTVLADDRGFFPPYDAAPLVNGDFYATRPRAVLALTSLAGRMSVDLVRRANEQIEVRGRPVPDVAAEFLGAIGLAAEAPAWADPAQRGLPVDPEDSAGAAATRLRPPTTDDRTGSTLAALPRHLWANRTELARQVSRHLLLVFASLTAAILVALPAGVSLERRRSLAGTAIRVAGLLQTIPGIALLAFMIPLLGIGVAPAIVALFLYSLLPILRNTYTGIVEAAPEAVAAGRALGMTEGQLLRRIRLPLAAPVIMAGIRTAAVINVGTATLAAFIGAGGLGDPIVAGLSLSDPVMILSGAVPAAALALVVDWGLGGAETLVAPKGVAEGRR